MQLLSKHPFRKLREKNAFTCISRRMYFHSSYPKLEFYFATPLVATPSDRYTTTTLREAKERIFLTKFKLQLHI